ISLMKTGELASSCYNCHQLGDKATREIPKQLGVFTSSRDAWLRRIQSSQAGGDMVRGFNLLGTNRALAMFADWTDRIAGGELPPQPPRPQGLERNIVITEWNWADAKTYMHDEVSTDRRNPSVNANGSIYGAPEMSTDLLPVLDPVHGMPSRLPIEPLDPKT